MVKVKQGNTHTFKMYTRVRSVVVDIYQSTTTLLSYKVVSRIVKNGRVWLLSPWLRCNLIGYNGRKEVKV